MMKLLFFVYFLAPLCNYWWFLVSCLLFLSFYLLFVPICSYFSSLSYGFGMDLVSYCMVFFSIWIGVLMIMASFSMKSNLSRTEDEALTSKALF